MIYKNIKEAVFLSRPNRFIAQCLSGGEEITAHVKNTGRCRELLIPGCKVWLDFSDNPARKTPCDLITVEKGSRLINMDSQAPNKIYEEYLAEAEFDIIKPEKTFFDSRFDFYTEKDGRKCYTEVKGVTLENDGIVMFPDAPTGRGVKHINGLIECKNSGFDAEIVFVIQMSNVKCFTPNTATHPEFAAALKKAHESGVKISAYDCRITSDSIVINSPVEVRI